MDDEEWDENWEDEDFDLDDEDWEDEDFDLDDEDYLDDEDWNDPDWFEEGNFTEDGCIYYYQLAYKGDKALGCCYMASNAYGSDYNKDMSAKDDTTSASDSKDDEISEDSTPDSDVPTASANYKSVAKTIDLPDKNSINADNSKNTSAKTTVNNETHAIFKSVYNELDIFAVLA